MRESVAINVIFSLKGICYGPKEVFWNMGDTHILVYYPIVYSCMIKYIEGWNNGKIDMEHFVEGVIDSIMGVG